MSQGEVVPKGGGASEEGFVRVGPEREKGGRLRSRCKVNFENPSAILGQMWMPLGISVAWSGKL